MKSLVQFIQEKLIIKKGKNYKYFPESTEELKSIIKKRIEKEGNEVNLNAIDVSIITDMHELFMKTNFNGDISNWDVSKVIDMSFMFYGCKSFNKDISNWDVSNVTNMNCMFSLCNSIIHDLSSWDVSKVITMEFMFCDCIKFNQDISGWNVQKVKNSESMFSNCHIQGNYKPRFK